MNGRLHTTALAVPVLNGAVEVIIGGRRLVNTYETNTDLKNWSCYFVLKALSVPGILHRYTGQLATLAKVMQCSVSTVKRRIGALEQMKLLSIEQDRLVLASFKEACTYLGIQFKGTTKIIYDYAKHTGKQFFRYLVMSHEIRFRQQLQLNALMKNLDKNPALKGHLDALLLQFGAIPQQLANPVYYQERLLQLQLQTFRAGSECYKFIMHFRADCNRGVHTIQKHYRCKSTSTVTYWKRALARAQIVTVASVSSLSSCRSRLYYVNDEGKKVQGYKWLKKAQYTKLFLCHQITTLHQVQPAASAAAAPQKAAVA